LEHLRTEIDQRVDKTLGTSTLGSVVVQPNPSYTVAEGGEVTVVFNAASPRHSPMRGGTFFVIEKQNESNGEWEISRTDADIDTTYEPLSLSLINEVIVKIIINSKLKIVTDFGGTFC
jgi:hypothetical protein